MAEENAPSPAQSAKASAHEIELMQKILVETLDFPIEFRQWLKRFVETAGILLPANAISGAGDWQTTFKLPAGTVLPFAGSSPPQSRSFLICNGQSVARKDYGALFAAIGTIYGAADANSFNVPDLRDRAVYGAGSKVGMGANDGGALGTRGPQHSHSFSGSTGNAGGHSHSASTNTAGAHQHGSNDPYAFATSSGSTYVVNSSSGTNRILILGTTQLTSSQGDHSHTVSVAGVGDHSHSFGGGTSGGGIQDTPGFMGMLYIIVTGL